VIREDAAGRHEGRRASCRGETEPDTALDAVHLVDFRATPRAERGERNAQLMGAKRGIILLAPAPTARDTLAGHPVFARVPSATFCELKDAYAKKVPLVLHRRGLYVRRQERGEVCMREF